MWANGKSLADHGGTGQMTGRERITKALADLGPVLTWAQTVVEHTAQVPGLPGVGAYRPIGVGWARTADGHLHVFVWEE
jgi:hypothetical protein